MEPGPLRKKRAAGSTAGPLPDPEPPTPQIPEAPSPDVPVWNISGFTLLDGRLVLLGSEEEVRGAQGEEGGMDGVGRCHPWSDCFCGDRDPACAEWAVLALRAASTWRWATSETQVRCGMKVGLGGQGREHS